MKFINRGRQGGKTTELLRLMAENDDLVYVAPTQAQAQYAYQMSRSLAPSVERDRFISVDQAVKTRLPHGKRIVVDELKSTLHRMFNATVFAVTDSPDEEPQPDPGKLNRDDWQRVEAALHEQHAEAAGQPGERAWERTLDKVQKHNGTGPYTVQGDGRTLKEHQAAEKKNLRT